jgi:uncharacterized protein (DUF362 family)
MSTEWDRRGFLKRLGLASAGVAGSTAVGLMALEPLPKPATSEPGSPQKYDFKKGLPVAAPLLAIGRGDPSSATRASIDALGGMARFVKRGETVAIKPNVAWDRTPVQAANTHPMVVATLVELCLTAGAGQVIVTDNTCNDAERCFTRSGIWKAAEGAGAKVVLPAEHRFGRRLLGGVLGSVPVLLPVVEADRLINVAIAKHHGLSGFTGAMKNLYGIIGGRRNRHHQDINASIVDLAAAFQATLSLVDATRVLLRNGPQGGDLSDTKAIGEVIASTDPVAADAYACTLIGRSPADLPYLAAATRQGIGSADPAAVERREGS